MLAQFNIILAMYVIPCVCTYLILRKYYKQEKEKKNSREEPTPADLILIFIPVFNVLVAFVMSIVLISRWISSRNKGGKSTMERFFKL